MLKIGLRLGGIDLEEVEEKKVEREFVEEKGKMAEEKEKMAEEKVSKAEEWNRSVML